MYGWALFRLVDDIRNGPRAPPDHRYSSQSGMVSRSSEAFCRRTQRCGQTPMASNVGQLHQTACFPSGVRARLQFWGISWPVSTRNRSGRPPSVTVGSALRAALQVVEWSSRTAWKSIDSVPAGCAATVAGDAGRSLVGVGDSVVFI